MLKNNLVIIKPKEVVLIEMKSQDMFEIKNREKNTYFNKIIGYSEKYIKNKIL
jgi:hypothetical protein